jgi:succinoglycan biosynthesis protein ExoA
MTDLPVVTVLIPARDEASDIEGCLTAIAAQDYPVNRLEVIVVDGASDDGTADVARRVLGRWGFKATAVIANEPATTPSNLNAGAAIAAGDIVCRVDARTRIEPHYVRTCVEVLERRPEVAVVGGAQIAVARDVSAKAIGIARALNNRYTMGGSPYRRATASGPSDTVYLGAFRTGQLRAAGGWDERLLTNQDYDLNQRMSEMGTVWFDARLRSSYLPRPDLRQLWQQYVRFGRWKARYWRLTGRRPARRQLVAMLSGPGAILGLAIAARRDLRLALAPVVSLVVIDARGTRMPRGSALARASAALAMCVIAGGWLTGVWAEVIAGSVERRPPVRPLSS